MTPPNAIEMANELIEKFKTLDVDVLYVDFENDTCITEGELTHESAKKCALIVIEQILSVWGVNPIALKYYNEVKSEISKQ